MLWHHFCHCLYTVLIISLDLMIKKLRVKAKLKKHNLTRSDSFVPLIDLTCDFGFKIKLLWKEYCCLHIFPWWCSLASLCLYLCCRFIHPLFRESSSLSVTTVKTGTVQEHTLVFHQVTTVFHVSGKPFEELRYTN